MSLSRREFLKASGALIVSFSAGSVSAPFAVAQGPFGAHPSHIDPNKLDSWIAVANDGTVTAYTGKCDLGQGMYTAQTQLVAEELCVLLERVKLIQCDTSACPDEGTTSGSQSTPTNFNHANLAQAAATARETLIAMAAKRLGEPEDRLTVANGVISGRTQRVSYGELIGEKRFNLQVSATAKRKSPDQWTILGKPVPSLDRVALMTGRFEFVHNVRVPGMLHGRVVRPPTVGATIAGVDEASIRGLAGVVKVVVRDNFVGLVAEKPWQAMQAATRLKVRWNPGAGLPAQKTFFETMRKQPSRDVLIVDSKDVPRVLAKSSAVLRATYAYPFQMHGSIGASCAIADVKPGSATIWSGTQSVYPTRSIVAELLRLPLDSVRVIYTRASGCYGLNGADAVSFDAALLSQAVGTPVRVQLSREDEMTYENFGSACVIEQRAGLNSKSNRIIAWECETWVATRGGRPGYDHPGNVITGELAGYKPEIVAPRAAAEPAGEFRNGNNAVPSYVVGCISGKCGGAGTVRSERVLSHTVASPFFTGPLRSPVRLQNTFAHECFMDELSARAKADPVEFRLRHLSDKRLINVLKAAVERSKWQQRSSPNPKRAGNRSVSGRGVACVAYEGDNGYTALIAEIEVDRTNGQIHPRKFTIAVDCGPVSNPDGLRNQIEGGLLQGMSRALVEEVRWDDRQVTSTTWATYYSLTLGFEIPQIDIVLMNPADVRATGAGETAITAVAAALGNAIFDAAGIRLREVPFTAERVKAALQAGRS